MPISRSALDRPPTSDVGALPAEVPSLLPENAPFSSEQRDWLNGFLAGLLSNEAGAGTAVGAEPPSLPAAADPAFRNPLDDDGDDGAAPWRDPALTLAERMRLAEGRPLRRRMMAAMAQQECGECGYTCAGYADEIALQAEERLDLCAPGGTETARMLKRLVEEMGGGVTGPDQERARAEAKAATRPEPRSEVPGYSRERPVEARLRSRTRLNRGASEKSTWHVEFDLAGSGIDYAVGDSLGVYPLNDAALVDAVVAAINAPPDIPVGDKTLRRMLREDMSLGSVPDMLFELISYMVGGERKAKARALARGDDPDGDAAELDVLAALQKFPGIRPDPEAFVECLEALQPRLYSISSSPKVDPDTLALTVDQVRYEVGGRRRLGVASTFLCESVEPGTLLRVYVQRAQNFALPENLATPIVMVGPGTGVAPFRAFLQERAMIQAPGDAWLFFGHQRKDCDFLYEEEFGGLLANQTLTRLSLAWSRDAAPKTYVQDRMREEAADLWAWLQRGAHFYVCGDAQRMAGDVENTLVAIARQQGGLAEDGARAWLADLKIAGRYQTDVY